MYRTIQTIKHGHWSTTIEKRPRGSYRVTTCSGIRDLEPQTFCLTLEQAKKAAERHMREVSAL